MNSPFYQIRSTLVFMRRVFGFPLQPKDVSFEEFKFITRIEALRFLFISLLPLAIHLYWFIVFLASDQHLVNLLNLEVFIFKNYSRSKMDIATALVWALASSTITTAYLILFKRNVKAINAYCSDFSQARAARGGVGGTDGRRHEAPVTVAPLLPDPPARPPWVLLPGEPRPQVCVCAEVPPRFWLKNAISGWNIQTITTVQHYFKAKTQKKLRVCSVKNQPEN